MATFTIGIQCDNIAGATNFKVRYRLMGDSVWTAYLIPANNITGTTTPQLLDNRIYDFQIQNINESTNDLSIISQYIGITEPVVVITPTSTAVGYSIQNLSVDMVNYNVQLTTAADPATILGTHRLSAGTYPNTISDTFTGLMPATAYRLVVTPVANQFSQPFVYPFVTVGASQCPNVPTVTATLQ